jgi:hypothetical protein
VIQELINSRKLSLAIIIPITMTSPATGTMKTMNLMMIIFNASGPEASPKVRLANPVRAKINARVPRRIPDILFRKIPAHWINVRTMTTEFSLNSTLSPHP